MFARHNPTNPDGLVLAAKGGHNGEMHNQNDVGNFIVHVKGESIIPDIGRGRYTKAYFGPERYEHLVNSSQGHSVPVPNGQLQMAGAEYGTTLLAHQATALADVLHLELKDAYPAEADLQSLQRRLTLHRDEALAWIEVLDTVEFVSKPGSFETALTVFGHIEIGDDGLVIEGDRAKVRVGFDPELVSVNINVYYDVDFALAPTNVNRIAFSLKEPVQQGQIRLEIVPV